ncbi:carbon catabolite repressor protein 4-like [Heracleum sosnowskyi]|uniref:Carbon catabolite repressor protein 4-like n=1 Tax=Heracleum sosnowskyi TaxID=360622 RepID=A0AAD8GNR8_9APIA|nr:carbon catabolite repressor protein 4-like [Heracleum sosnowskyi]
MRNHGAGEYNHYQFAKKRKWDPPNESCSSKKIKRSSNQHYHVPRKWVYANDDYSHCKDRVVFVSYNILGVENATNHPDLYYKVPQEFLDWDCRKEQIRLEIAKYNPSILCFQEVDRYDDLDKFLQQDGYTGVYQARTGDSCDGCATFWKTEQFTVLHVENIEFKKFGLRDNVAQLCVLKMNNKDPNRCGEESQTPGLMSSRILLVGNIHVLFNPKRGDIKLGQVRLFLEKAHELSQQWGNIPTILGGDLNSMPQSAMYNFLASSELDIRSHERRIISGQIAPFEYPRYTSYKRNNMRWSAEESRLATGTKSGTHVKHQLKLRSAYLGVPGSARTRDIYGEPLATSYHSRFLGTVDYIWHTEDLVPVRVLETLSIDNLRQLGGLPSKNWGSDHLALVCELAFLGDYIGD